MQPNILMLKAVIDDLIAQGKGGQKITVAHHNGINTVTLEELSASLADAIEKGYGDRTVTPIPISSN